MQSVLLVGCGNIGFRHLQALVQLPQATAISIVEPNLAAHPRIATLIAEHAGPHRLELHAALPQTAAHFDLAVLATSANHRRVIIEDLLARHSVAVMILEKVLFQRLEDLDAVLVLLTAQAVTTYVNCGRRYFPGYIALQQRFAAQSQALDILITGQAFGLASNAVHFIDLAEYLNGSAISKLDGTGLLADTVTAKRADCVEIFGSLTAQFANGARLTVDCRADGPLAVAARISGQGVDISIDEVARNITESGVTTAFVSKNVSECVEIYAAALQTGQCDLTRYADSARQHRLYLSAVLAHLGLPQTAICPIS
jgi:predicted dehydrogenase